MFCRKTRRSWPAWKTPGGRNKKRDVFYLLFHCHGNSDNLYLPHNFVANTVVYTGTHDNDTTVGWWNSLPAHERDYARRYLGITDDAIHWDFIRAASASVADLCIIPLQDVLGLDAVYSELLPQDKVAKVEEFLREEDKHKKLAFVGDGINDAPVLSRADVGIAMGAMGSDAAIEAADIVLMDDDPLKISVAKRIAKKTLRIVHQNIVFSIGVKVIVLVLGAIGLASMWAAIFADVGVMIIAVLNAMRALFAGGRAPVIPAAKNEGKTAAESLADDKAAGAVSSPQETSAVHSYKIDVDCANCANLMEGAAKKTAGVRNAVVNFMMQEMKVEFRDGADPQQVMQQVRTNCKKVEDDCEIYL